MHMGKNPDSIYAVTDPELTSISEKRDLSVSVDGSTEVSCQCLAVVTIKSGVVRKGLLNKTENIASIR